MNQTTNILGTEKGNEGREHYNPIDIAKEVEVRLEEEKRQKKINQKLHPEVEIEAKPKVEDAFEEESSSVNGNLENNNSHPTPPSQNARSVPQFNTLDDIINYLRVYPNPLIRKQWPSRLLIRPSLIQLHGDYPTAPTNDIYITREPVPLAKTYSDTKNFLKGSPFFLPSVDFMLEHINNARLAHTSNYELAGLRVNPLIRNTAPPLEEVFLTETDAKIIYAIFYNNNPARIISSWVNEKCAKASPESILFSSEEYDANSNQPNKCVEVNSILKHSFLPLFPPGPMDQKSWRKFRSDKDIGFFHSWFSNSQKYPIFQGIPYDNNCYNFNLQLTSKDGKPFFKTVTDNTIVSSSYLCINKDDFIELYENTLSKQNQTQ